MKENDTIRKISEELKIEKGHQSKVLDINFNNKQKYCLLNADEFSIPEYRNFLNETLTHVDLSNNKDYIWTKKGLNMKLSESVKSISYLKANAADLIDNINKNQKTFVITQNGEAKVVVQDIKLYEKTQETLSMLKLLAMTNEVNPKAKGIKVTFNELRKELNKK